jgi:molybdopterin synthase sulfur carrier subunit
MTVRLFAAAAEAAGAVELSTQAASLVALKAELTNDRPALSAVLPRCSYLVDGLSVGREQDADLRQAQTVDVLPPFAGG